MQDIYPYIHILISMLIYSLNLTDASSVTGVAKRSIINRYCVFANNRRRVENALRYDRVGREPARVNDPPSLFSW
jgi:hypothetical protein